MNRLAAGDVYVYILEGGDILYQTDRRGRDRCHDRIFAQTKRREQAPALRLVGACIARPPEHGRILHKINGNPKLVGAGFHTRPSKVGFCTTLAERH